ncbi:AAA family ATPase [Actinomadura rudentiformis]|uniref:AAA family ATPase n=2 Tax=Actinomadura rudentiformis TaxID=359158 RepID=A0A6H9YT91_9ACTN|nr:AAA family ATPase [Actinomadura rudentiformis]
MERGILADRLADAGRGHGQVVVVRGEPGIGKSALLDDAAAHATGMTVLRCTGVESEIDLPYGGLHQLLAPVCAQLDGLADAHRDVVDRLWPTTRSATTTAASETTPGAVGAAVLAAWQLLASRRPLLVVVDDAHWLDTGSARAVLFAARRITTDPIAVLVARRDLDEADHFSRAGFPTLPVGGLAPDAVGELLAGQGWSPPRRIVEVLTERSGGNPLALLELAVFGDTGHLSATGSMSKTVPLTDRLRDAFTDRLRALPEHSRRALVVAAADETGQYDVVLGALARSGLGADALTAAEAARLLVVSTVAAHPETLRFRHPLMRSAVYHNAPFAHRAEAHEALAAELTDHDPARAAWHRALAATGTDEQRARTLAHHAAQLRSGGGLAASSAAYQRAAQLTRFPERRRHHLLTAAYDAWKAADSARAQSLAAQAAAIAVTPSSVGGGSAHQTDVDLERLQGYMQWYTGDQVIAAARLAGSVDDARMTAPHDIAAALFAACDASWQAGEIATAQSLTRRLGTEPGGSAYRRAAQVLEAAMDDRLTPEDGAISRLAGVVPADLGTGDPRRWLWLLAVAARGPDPALARALGLQVADRFRTSGMFSLLTVALSWLVEIEYQMGQWEAGIAHAEEGLRHAEDAEHLARQADLAAHLARLAAVRGDAEGGRVHSRTALTLAWRTRHRLAAARATWADGLLALATGDHREAFELIGSTSGPLPSGHPDIGRKATADLVEASLRCGEVETAKQAAADLSSWAHGRTSPWVDVQVLRCRALLTAYDGDPSADKDCATSAAAAVRAQMPFEQARIAVLHGEWARRGRRPTEARKHLRTAVALFDRLGASHWSEHARTQLRALGGAADHRPADLAGRLTPQELQVARLAAQGLSNREIGTRLFLSPRTVGYHLYKLFPKLGIASRAQLRHLGLFELDGEAGPETGMTKAGTSGA